MTRAVDRSMVIAMLGGNTDTRLSTRQIDALYRKLAPFYDAFANLTEVRARRTALECAAVRDGEAVLEVAVGTGLAFEEIVRKNAHGRNTGVDLNLAMLRRARRRVERLPARGGPKPEFAIADVRALPLADASFDLVLASYLFDLLPEAAFAPALGEMARVLRPGGRMVLVNLTSGSGLLGRLAERVYRVRPQWMGGCRAVALAPFVAAAGLSDVTCERVSELGVASEIVSAHKPAAAC